MKNIVTAVTIAMLFSVVGSTEAQVLKVAKPDITVEQAKNFELEHKKKVAEASKAAAKVLKAEEGQKEKETEEKEAEKAVKDKEKTLKEYEELLANMTKALAAFSQVTEVKDFGEKLEQAIEAFRVLSATGEKDDAKQFVASRDAAIAELKAAKKRFVPDNDSGPKALQKYEAAVDAVFKKIGSEPKVTNEVDRYVRAHALIQEWIDWAQRIVDKRVAERLIVTVEKEAAKTKLDAANSELAAKNSLVRPHIKDLQYILKSKKAATDSAARAELLKRIRKN